MKKLLLILLLSISLCILSNCSIEVEHSDTPSYSREDVNILFGGYGADSQEIIACKYIYNNNEFSKMYGDDFEIKNALCTSEMENSLGFIKGTGICRVYINDDIWCLLLTKNYLTEWTVVDYYKCAIDPEDGDVIIKDGQILREEDYNGAVSN